MLPGIQQEYSGIHTPLSSHALLQAHIPCRKRRPYTYTHTMLHVPALSFQEQPLLHNEMMWLVSVCKLWSSMRCHWHMISQGHVYNVCIYIFHDWGAECMVVGTHAKTFKQQLTKSSHLHIQRWMHSKNSGCWTHNEIHSACYCRHIQPRVVAICLQYLCIS